MSLFDRIKNLLRFNTPRPSTQQTETRQRKSLFSRVRKTLSDVFSRKPKTPKEEVSTTQAPTPKATDEPKKSKPDTTYSDQIKKELKKNTEQVRKKFYEQTDKQAGRPEDAPLKSDIILQELERRIERWEAQLSIDDPRGMRNQNLRHYLENEIATYGRAKVAYSCENAGKTLITNAEIYVWDSDENNREAAWTMIVILIGGGEVPDEQTRKDIGNEADIVDDYNPFEE